MKKVLEWIDGEKGPWAGSQGIDMVSLGLKCSVDQLLNTGLFHADPHRGNLLRETNGNLAFIDFVSPQIHIYVDSFILCSGLGVSHHVIKYFLFVQGMMADVTEEERWGLVGLAIGLQNKDLSLITENLLNVSGANLANNFLVDHNCGTILTLFITLRSLGSWTIQHN